MSVKVIRKGSGPALIKPSVARVLPWGKLALMLLGVVFAILVAHPAFDLTSRLGQERTRSQHRRDCRERETSRNASEGADTALLHEVVLQRREPAGSRTACRWDRLSRRGDAWRHVSELEMSRTRRGPRALGIRPTVDFGG